MPMNLVSIEDTDIYKINFIQRFYPTLFYDLSCQVNNWKYVSYCEKKFRIGKAQFSGKCEPSGFPQQHTSHEAAPWYPDREKSELPAQVIGLRQVEPDFSGEQAQNNTKRILWELLFQFPFFGPELQIGTPSALWTLGKFVKINWNKNRYRECRPVPEMKGAIL